MNDPIFKGLYEGHFQPTKHVNVFLEGVDGTGKSTLAQGLSSRIAMLKRVQGTPYKVEFYKFPTEQARRDIFSHDLTQFDRDKLFFKDFRQELLGSYDINLKIFDRSFLTTYAYSDMTELGMGDLGNLDPFTLHSSINLVFYLSPNIQEDGFERLARRVLSRKQDPKVVADDIDKIRSQDELINRLRYIDQRFQQAFSKGEQLNTKSWHLIEVDCFDSPDNICNGVARVIYAHSAYHV